MEHEENDRFIGRFREYSAKTSLMLELGGTFLAHPPSQFFLRVLAIYCGHPKPAARCQPKCDAALDQHNLCQTSIMDKLSASKRTQKDFQIKKNFVLCWPTPPPLIEQYMQVAAPLESALNKSPILFSVSNFIILSLVRTIKGIQDYVLYDRLRLFPRTNLLRSLHAVMIPRAYFDED